MNKKAKQVINNLRYAISANFSVMIISIIINLILPKYLSIEGYGFWQLYILYFGFVGFFHLGWLDGIYLKEGGNYYENLDKKKLSSQFWYHLLYECLMALLLGVVIHYFIQDESKRLILNLTVFSMIVANTRTFMLLLFQATNKIKEYSHLARDDKYIYLFFSIVYFFLGGRSYVVLIIFDIFSKMIVSIWGIYLIRDIIKERPIPLKESLLDIKENINIGMSLMLSTIVGGLILSFSRFLVENKWDISTFARLSFTLSISNMFMIFINASGMVIFPLLRRTNENKLKYLYISIRSIFTSFSFCILLFFIPFKLILEQWLPEYSESLFFMGILFPMIVYEGRMSLLVSTFLKTLRKEKVILKANVISLLISILLSLISVFLLNNLILTIMSIMISLAARCIIAEILLMNIMKLNIKYNLIFELILTVVFIYTNLFLSNSSGFFVYLIAVFIFIISRLKQIKESFFDLFKLLKSDESV